MDKSILFLLLALACFWLVLDQITGNKYVSKFVVAIIPGAED